MDTPVKTSEVEALRAELQNAFTAGLAGYFTYEQACQALGGISRYTLSRLISEGKLSATERIKNRRYISGESLRQHVTNTAAELQNAIKRAAPQPVPARRAKRPAA